MPELYPLFLKMQGKKVLIVGGGTLGLQKLKTLAGTGAVITLVAPRIKEEIFHWGGKEELVLIENMYETTLLEGTQLVFAATGRQDLNGRIVAEASVRGILANAVDDPQQCDFYTPSVLRRGAFTLALTTSGGFPGLARALRVFLDALLPQEDEPLLGHLIALRKRMMISEPDSVKRSEALKKLARDFSRSYLNPGSVKSTDRGARGFSVVERSRRPGWLGKWGPTGSISGPIQ